MAYVILDPVDDYAAHMMRFLARMGHGAVAVFTTERRHQLWHFHWSKQLSHTTLATFLAPSAPSIEVLAAHILDRFDKLDGIIPWDEANVLYGAALGEALGLDWSPLAVIERCRDKSLLKAWIRSKSGIRVNASTVVGDAADALAFQRRLGRWPLVVKPTGGAGSSHVYFVANDGELLAACQRVQDAGAAAVLLEEFVGGRELAVNGLTDPNSDILVTDMWVYDKRPSHGQDNICFGASKLSSDHPVFRRVAAYAAEVVEVVGLRRAPFHMEVKIDEWGPCLIELGPRFAGGELPTLASALHQRDLFELAACHYLAELPLRRSEVNFPAYDARAAMVVQGAQPVALARIEAVEGVERVENLPSFLKFGMVRPVGKPAPKSVDLDSRAWELYLMHPDPAQVAEDAEVCWEVLKYR